MLAPSAGPEVVTLGCRLNLAESEHIRAMLGSRDVVVVNSCAVTAEALKTTRAAIRRARRLRPGAELIVTGCAASIDSAAIGDMGEVDRLIPNAIKLDPASWGATQEPVITRPTGHARAFVAVQTGCNHACTFCIIPAGRGPSRSLAAGVVVEQVRTLVDQGCREVVLTGVDVTSYGTDLPGAPSLGSLVERVLMLTAVERIRLSSLDGIEIDDRLFDLLAGEPRVMPHVHLSLQAGDDLILKRMKRRHSRAQAIALVERLKRRRDVAVGADLIAGFPTEDEAMFKRTLAVLDDCDVVHPHIFPYSPRPGTPAARMPQVATPVVRARATRLREAAAARRAAWLRSLDGTRQHVLVERPGDRGHSEGFADIRLSQLAPVGSVTRVTVAAQGDHLIGTPS
jgi:threonylcarbamoyladenosine tRNA methylthiotransferase MtaB